MLFIAIFIAAVSLLLAGSYQQLAWLLGMLPLVVVLIKLLSGDQQGGNQPNQPAQPQPVGGNQGGKKEFLKKNWPYGIGILMLIIAWAFNSYKGLDGTFLTVFTIVIIVIMLFKKFSKFPEPAKDVILLLIYGSIIAYIFVHDVQVVSESWWPKAKEVAFGTRTVICKYEMTDMSKVQLDSVRVNGEDGMACELAPGVWRMEVMNNSHYRYLHANKVDYMDASLKKGGHDVHESELSLLPYNKENGWNGALLASVDGSYWQPSGNVLTVASLSTVQVQLNIVPGTAQGGIVGSVPITFLFTSQQ